MTDLRAIGVFDSGLGGLTVLSAIHRALPNESTVYLGDTARVPYGTRSAQTVIRYALNNARALLSYAPLKMLVVACNTVSAVALDALSDALSIPVIGVIEPGVRAALAKDARSIVVLATAGTVQSKAYETILRKQGFEGQVFSQACPLFVPLVEEGIIAGTIASSVASHYLACLPSQVDTVILGCTHYPLLLSTLKSVFPTLPQWIDSGHETAAVVRAELEGRGMTSTLLQAPTRRYLVTDAPARFEQLSEFYLGKPLSSRNVELIDVGIGA